MKLFLVECQGMKINATSAPWGIAYILAEDPTEAYEKLKSRLKEADAGYPDDRELDKVTLIAEDGLYPKCRMQLII